MNWDWAQKQLAIGLRVRRPDWCTALYSYRDVILWDITDALARKCNEDGSTDRTYQPHETDTVAQDWALAA